MKRVIAQLWVEDEEHQVTMHSFEIEPHHTDNEIGKLIVTLAEKIKESELETA